MCIRVACLSRTSLRYAKSLDILHVTRRSHMIVWYRASQIFSYSWCHVGLIDRATLDSIIFFPLSYVGQLKRDEAELISREQDEHARTVSTVEDIEARQKEVAARIATYSVAEQEKYQAKKAARQQARAQKVKRSSTDVRNCLRHAQSDSLIIASHYEPLAILTHLLPLLGCSKPFVVYCEYLEPLVAAFDALQHHNQNQTWMQGQAEHEKVHDPRRTVPSPSSSSASSSTFSSSMAFGVINLQLSDTWTREYQVLPGRTHPEMSMSAGSGYLLTGIKVEASRILLATSLPERSHDDMAKRQRV
jgi:tRNA (adenine-N(1)-)-methyltransferase non-catalytic subunit